MRLWTALKRSFVAGIVLLIPLLITLYILQILVNFALGFIDPVVQNADLEGFTGDVELLARAIAVTLILVVVTVIGYIAQKPLGQRLFGSLGRIVSIIPIVRTIYSTVRQLSTSFSGSENSYDSLVLIEFPRKGMYAIGLVTSQSPVAVEDVAGETVQNIFLPSSPNPASGRFVMVPESQIHEVELSFRQGMRLLMTTGAAGRNAPEIPESIKVPLEPETERLDSQRPREADDSKRADDPESDDDDSKRADDPESDDDAENNDPESDDDLKDNDADDTEDSSGR
jgi:uncharacterized membrane protein